MINNNLPQSFCNYVVEVFGKEIADNLFETLTQTDKSVAIRTNPFKNVELIFNDKTLVPWCSNGFYLSERPIFTLDPLFHAGAYYVQDPSSMYMELILKEIGYSKDNLRNGISNIKVLDLCAAPGGKSTHILSLLDDSSLLVSNEVIKNRATILGENIMKWGRDNVIVTNNDPADFKKITEWFDIVIVDAPCSGEGMFRKDPNAISEWSESNVQLCAARQQRILSDIWESLKPGGYLVYSTCTFNKYENDFNLLFLKDSFNAQIIDLKNISKDFPQLIRTENGGIQFIPGRIEGEGQYLALVRKEEGEEEKIKYAKPKKGSKIKLPEFLNEFLPLYVPELKNDLIKLIPSLHEKEVGYLNEKLRVIASGRGSATTVNAPYADLALSTQLEKIDIPKVEINREIALKFLAKEPVLFAGEPKGYLLLTYHGLGLGFVKNLGNRTNTLHPNARRIRMDINT